MAATKLSMLVPESERAHRKCGWRWKVPIILSPALPPYPSAPCCPLELQLFGHFGSNVPESMRCPPEALKTNSADICRQVAYFSLESYAGAGSAVCAGEEEWACLVHLAAAALCCLAYCQHHLGWVPRTLHLYIPAASGGPGLCRFLIPR